MTGFELWQAGEGPEPVVIPKLPAALAFMPPWKWRHLRHRERRPGTWAPGQLTELLATVRREEAEAAEECRAALERMVARARAAEIMEDLLALDATDTYCEWCQRHAPKHFGGPRDGTPCGPIPHAVDCPRAAAETVIRLERQVPCAP